LRHQDLFVGFGVAEAARKTIIRFRLKQSGMRWMGSCRRQHIDRARRLHSNVDSINQVTKHAPRAPVQLFVVRRAPAERRVYLFSMRLRRALPHTIRVTECNGSGNPWHARS
jgi:hypothetical protein